MSAPDGCARERSCFAYAAHFHAQMMRFQENRHTMWMQHRFQCVCNLLTDSLLHRKSFCKEAHQTGQLGNSDNVLMRNVAHISPAVKRKSMVLTQREKRDGSFQYLAETTVGVAAAFGIKNAQQFRIAIIAFRCV